VTINIFSMWLAFIFLFIRTVFCLFIQLFNSLSVLPSFVALQSSALIEAFQN